MGYKKKQVYQKLSQIDVKEPDKTNLILTIGDIHGDVYTMLQPLAKNGIIKIVSDHTTKDGYRIKQGPYKDKFKRVVFLGDYVDRGDFSLESMENVIKLDKLFNTKENGKTTTGEEDRQDFMRFLCGNHDVFTKYLEYSYIERRKNMYSETIQNFQKCLSIAHVEQLDDGQKLYFTHAACSEDTKNNIDNINVVIEICDQKVKTNMLNKGEFPKLENKLYALCDASDEPQTVHKDLFHYVVESTFWQRETCEEELYKGEVEEFDAKKGNSLFIHGHTIIEPIYDNTKSERDKYEDRCRRSLTRLKENHMTSIDFGNSHGFNIFKSTENEGSNSSYMVFDQEGHYYIEGSSLSKQGKIFAKYYITDFPQISDDMVQVTEKQKEDGQMAEIYFDMEPTDIHLPDDIALMLNGNKSKEPNKGTLKTVETREESNSDLAFDLEEYTEYIRNQKDTHESEKKSCMSFENQLAMLETVSLLNDGEKMKEGEQLSYTSFDDLINSSETTSLLHSAESDDKLSCGINTMSKISTDTKKAQSPRSFKNYFRCCLGREQ